MPGPSCHPLLVLFWKLPPIPLCVFSQPALQRGKNGNSVTGFSSVMLPNREMRTRRHFFPEQEDHISTPNSRLRPKASTAPSTPCANASCTESHHLEKLGESEVITRRDPDPDCIYYPASWPRGRGMRLGGSWCLQAGYCSAAAAANNCRLEPEGRFKVLWESWMDSQSLLPFNEVLQIVSKALQFLRCVS